MTTYLSIAEVLDINRGFVGPDQLRDSGLLDAAVMRPQSSAFGADAFPSLHEKGAALLHGLARNHPFVDGNKRTSWSATAMFYLVNGHSLPVGSDDVVSLMLDAAEGRRDVEDIAATLRDWAQPVLPDDDWMDTPPAHPRMSRIDESEIAELTQKMFQDLNAMQAAHGLDHNLKVAFAGFWESLDEMAESVEQLVELGLPLSKKTVKKLRGFRQKVLDGHPDMPAEWAESVPAEWAERVNAHPVFVMLDAIDNQRPPNKSPARSKKKPKRRRR